MTILAVGRNLRIACVAAAPSAFGIMRSMTMTSGLSVRANWTTSSPLVASPAISMSGSSLSIERRPTRMSAWSSAMRMRIAVMT